MIDNISDTLPTCEACNMSKWGVKMQADGELVSYCTVCSGDYAHTKEARDAAEALLDPNA